MASTNKLRTTRTLKKFTAPPRNFSPVCPPRPRPGTLVCSLFVAAAWVSLAGMLVGTATPATAQETWVGNPAGNWTDSANWLGGVVPPVGGSPTQTLTFSVSPSGTTQANYTNNLGGVFSLNTLTLDNSGTATRQVANATGNSISFTGTDARITQAGLGQFNLGAGGNNYAVTDGLTIEATNLGNITLAGAISGTGPIVVNGLNGPSSLVSQVTLSGISTFTGGVVLNSGNLLLSTSASNTGLGGLTINGGTVGYTATFSTQTKTWTLNSDLVFVGTSPGTFTTGGLTGTGGVQIAGTAGLTFQSAQTYTGNTLIGAIDRPNQLISTAGIITVNNQNGSILNSNNFTIGANGVLLLANNASTVATAANSNRIADTATINIEGVGCFGVTGNAAATISETVGTINVRGHSIISAISSSTTAGAPVTLTAAELNRQDRATVLFRSENNNFGNNPATAVARVLFTNAPTGSLVGGGGAAGSANISILPFAGFVNSSSLTVPSSFVTYGANGVRALDLTTEYAALVSGSATTNNVRVQSATELTAATTVNSLLASANITGTAPLTITSGAVMVTAAAVTTDVPLNFGSAEAVFQVASGSLTINGSLSGTNGLTKSGTGSLIINGANTISGPLTINQGVISVEDLAALGADTSAIIINPGRGTTGRAGITYNGTDPAVLSRDITSTNQTVGSILLGGAGDWTIAGVISGNNGVYLSNSGTLTLAGANTYTGPTYIDGSTGFVAFASDTAFGNGGALHLDASSDGGLRLLANWTTSRNINVGTSTQIDTNGFDATINGVITASTTSTTIGIVQAGGGTVTITNGSNTATTAYTINPDGGTLRLAGDGLLRASNFNLNDNARLVLDNTATNATNRILDTGTINLTNAEIVLLGNAGSSSETVGTVNRTGSNILTLDPAAGASTVFTITTLGGTGDLLVRGTNLGTTGPNSSQVFIDSQAVGLVTGVTVATSATATSGSLAFYDLAAGLRPATTSDFYTDSSNIIQNAPAISTPNDAVVLIDGAWNTAASTTEFATTVSALVLNPSASLAVNNVLTLTSGAVFTNAGPGSAAITGVFGALDFAANQASFFGDGNLDVSVFLSGTGGLAKSGAGTLTITSDLTALTGAFALSGGTLNIGPGLSANFSTMSGSSGTTLNIGAGSLVTFTGTGTLASDITGAGGLTLTGTTTIARTLTGNNPFSGGLTVITGTGTATVNFVDPASLGTGTIFMQSNTADSTGATVSLSLNAPGNFTVANDIVLLGGTGGFDANTADTVLTLSGQISGPGSLLIRGLNSNAGRIVLTNTANSYQGATTINNGILTISTPAVLGQTSQISHRGGSLETTTSMTLTMNHLFATTISAGGIIAADGTTLTLTGDLQGTATARFAGLGNVVVASTANSHTGIMSIASGTVTVTGVVAPSTSVVNVLAGATLAGAGDGLFGGVINRSVNVNVAGATLAPGLGVDGSTGQLFINNNLNLTNGTFEVDLNGTLAGVDYDQVIVGGLATTVTVSNAILAGTTGYTPDLADRLFILDNQTANPITGVFANDIGGQVALGGFFWSVSYTGDIFTQSLVGGNDIVLFDPTPIPEPTTVMLTLLGGAATLMAVRRRGTRR